MYYPAETRITALTTIRRERLLPVPGDVFVAPGDEVRATDVVARCDLPVEVYVIDLSRALGVSRDAVHKHICKQAGDAVQAEEVVAAVQDPNGAVEAECRSPVDGRVTETRDGLVLIEAEAAFELLAGMRGQITHVVPARGVVVATQGALLQGVWGSGPEVVGTLNVPLDNPLDALRPRHMDGACQGTLLVAGRLLDETVFQRAAEAGVAGLVVGSLDAGLLTQVRALPFSQLRSDAGCEATLCAEVRSPEGAGRPELLIPKMAPADLPAEPQGGGPLREGMQVRGLREPFLGRVGVVRALPSSAQIVESGARLMVAAVELDSEPGTVLIPLANLEIVR
jgi:hypothetical protein